MVIGCVDPGARGAPAAAPPGVANGRKRTVTGRTGATDALATSSGTGTRDVARGLGCANVGAALSGSAAAATGLSLTVIGRGAPAAGAAGAVVNGDTLGGTPP